MNAVRTEARTDPLPRSDRRRLLWFVGALFVLMAGIAAWRVVALREVAIDRERTRLQEFVEDQVSLWEDALLKDLQDRVEAASSDPERASSLERAWRRHRWFDSLFLWAPPRQGADPVILFPQTSAPDADLRIKVSPCLKEADRLATRGVTLDQLASAWVFGCSREDDNVRLVAASRAAWLLMSARRFDDALFALDAVRLPEALSLRNGAVQGIDPFRLATWRAQRIQLLSRLDRTEEALDAAVRFGDQLADLEAPDLAPVGPHMREVTTVLSDGGRTADVSHVERLFARAERRKHAYEEVIRRLLHEPVDPSAPPPARLVSDAYSDQPFLLYYGWANGLGVGLALEQDPLIDEFLNVRMRKSAGAIMLVDARTDRWVAGAKSGGQCAIVVPFTRTLTHLRVCLRETSVDAAIAGMREQWYVPLFVIAFCVGIGLAALVAVDRATRQEYELLHRQRAFSTRVTHELKTPLAGIRVMAENLELGAFRDEGQRAEMAHRIVVEADQLTKRLDEVLAVARQRTIPKPEPFDPEEMLLLAIDEWGPRLRDAGVDMHAELGPTDAVLGDGAAFKDAIACLVDNALKYRNEARTDAKVWLELAQVGKNVVVSVRDNGLGVPKNMRKRIFERFVRVEGPHRGKAGGHGLGLHQVKEIITAHGGTVVCQEGVDGGAAFVVRVPALRSAGR